MSLSDIHGLRPIWWLGCATYQKLRLLSKNANCTRRQSIKELYRFFLKYHLSSVLFWPLQMGKTAGSSSVSIQAVWRQKSQKLVGSLEYLYWRLYWSSPRQVGTGFRLGGTIEERNKLISEKFRIDPKLSNIVIRNETCLLNGRYISMDNRTKKIKLLLTFDYNDFLENAKWEPVQSLV